jgi:hypothetical protein
VEQTEVQNSLFEEPPETVQISPAQTQAQLYEQERLARKREAQNRRQRRCRQAKRDRKHQASGGQVSHPQAEVSRPPVEMSRSELPGEIDTPELRLLLDAFAVLSQAELPATRGNIARALDQSAQVAGVVLLDSSRFLDSAYERGRLPKFSGEQWVTVPAEVLSFLLKANG